jgi:hypothetical protein
VQEHVQLQVQGLVQVQVHALAYARENFTAHVLTFNKEIETKWVIFKTCHNPFKSIL